MISPKQVILPAYWTALRLYPRPFYQEYGEEMKAVFAETCETAAEVSPWAVWKLAFWELYDLPGNLVKEHWATFWGKLTNPPPYPREPGRQSILRGALGFGISFTLIALLYCLLVSVFTPKGTHAQGVTIWQSIYSSPMALASGIGAAILGVLVSKRRAWLSALIGFLGYTSIYLLWYFLVIIPRRASFPEGTSFDYLIAPFILQAIIGMIVGGGIGLIQRGWGKTRGYALAGALGFMLGWLVDRVVAAWILQQSPYLGFIVRMEIGTLWYFGYMLIPTLLYGMMIGLCLGWVAARSTRSREMAVS